MALPVILLVQARVKVPFAIAHVLLQTPLIAAQLTPQVAEVLVMLLGPNAMPV